MKKCFVSLFALAALPAAALFSGCGSSDTAAAPEVPKFTSALSLYLPKAVETTSATMLRGRGLGLSLMSLTCSSDAYQTTPETYGGAGGSVTDGCGLVGRTMGASDPLSVWATLDTIDYIAGLIDNGTLPSAADAKTVTLPFGIGEAAQSGDVTHTFRIATYSLQEDIGGTTMYSDVENIVGGWTEKRFGLAFHFKGYIDAAKTQKMFDSQFLFYGDLGDSEHGITMRAARYEFEDGLDDKISRAIFVFDAPKDSANYQYRAVSEYKHVDDNAWVRLSAIMTGTQLDANNQSKFIVRKRTLHCDTSLATCSGTDGIDQWFAASYNGNGTTTDERFGTTADSEASDTTFPFANWTDTTAPAVTDHGDANFVVPANMYDVVNNTTVDSILPENQAALTPTDW